MAETALADTSFLIALLRERDRYREWAIAQAARFPPPWRTCGAVLAEAFHLRGPRGGEALILLLGRHSVLVAFEFAREQERVLDLMKKYADVPMSLVDACLVRMTETRPDPMVLTAGRDFRTYRRHSRQVIPCAMP